MYSPRRVYNKPLEKVRTHPLWCNLPMVHIGDIADCLLSQMDHEKDYDEKLQNASHCINLLSYYCADSEFILREPLSDDFLSQTPLKAVILRKLGRNYP